MIESMDTVKVMSVIETKLLRRGVGIPADPVRVVTQYWDMDGRLIFEIDSEKQIENILAVNQEKIYKAICDKVVKFYSSIELKEIPDNDKNCFLKMMANEIWEEVCKILED